MMKKMKAKKRGILKYILFVPTILAFTLMATAAGQKAKTIEGKVYLETTDVPAFGASVIIAGTTMGTVADKDGAFTLEVTGNPEITISFVGYETAWLSAREIDRKPVVLVPTSYEIVFDEQPLKKKNTEIIEVTVIKEKSEGDDEAETVKMKLQSEEGNLKILSDDGKEPVFVVNGKVVSSIKEIDPQQIKEIEVIKDTDHPVVKKYDAKNGVIMITMKEDADGKKGRKNKDRDGKENEMKEVEVEVRKIKNGEKDTETRSEIEEEVFIVVEDVPSFPGGRAALGQYIDTHLEYPAEASRKKMAGKVMVEFKVRTDGSLEDIRVAQSSNDIFNQSALAVFKDMPTWKPAKQRGKPVSCKVIVPVRFTPDEE